MEGRSLDFRHMRRTVLLLSSSILLVGSLHSRTVLADSGYVYSNGDICGLQSLLILETLQQYRNKSSGGFNSFYREVIKKLLNSGLMDGQSNNRKVFLLNEVHQNAQMAYTQGRKKIAGNAGQKRDDRLKKAIWQDCSKRIGRG